MSICKKILYKITYYGNCKTLHTKSTWTYVFTFILQFRQSRGDEFFLVQYSCLQKRS